MVIKTEVNGDIPAVQPSQIGDVIAIAKFVRDEFGDNFAVVFEAAIIVYYRVTFLESYPLSAHLPE